MDSACTPTPPAPTAGEEVFPAGASARFDCAAALLRLASSTDARAAGSLAGALVLEGVSILEVSARIIVVLVVWECITVVLQFVGPTLSGPSQFVGPGFGSTLVLAEI